MTHGSNANSKTFNVPKCEILTLSNYAFHSGGGGGGGGVFMGCPKGGGGKGTWFMLGEGAQILDLQRLASLFSTITLMQFRNIILKG